MWGYFVSWQRIKALVLVIRTCEQYSKRELSKYLSRSHYQIRNYFGLKKCIHYVYLIVSVQSSEIKKN